jgi:hypothetical protein
MVLVDHRGSGWSGSSVVAENCYHGCYQVVSGSPLLATFVDDSVEAPFVRIYAA